MKSKHSGKYRGWNIYPTPNGWEAINYAQEHDYAPEVCADTFELCRKAVDAWIDANPPAIDWARENADIKRDHEYEAHCEEKLEERN